ncbi:helicase-like transcription factor isoform X2 [Hyperolius riggenbachi]
MQHDRRGWYPFDKFLNMGLDTLSSTDDDSTSSEEDFDSLHYFGTMRGNVVGLRYYSGLINNNEMVALQREPNNQYDRNAVKVNNVYGEQIGHIKKELAAALAHIMDQKLAKIEGIVPYGANNAFTVPVNLSFWGTPENKQVVLDHMKKFGFQFGPLPKKSSGAREAGHSYAYSAPALQAVQMTTEQLKSEFDKLFEDLKEEDKTREIEPAKAVETPLLPHQKQALAWMISRENNEELPPFWEQKDKSYYNSLTCFSKKEKPQSVRGGILADDMGLGKTLSIIALILTNFHDGQPLPIMQDGSDVKKQKSFDEEKSPDPSQSSSNKLSAKQTEVINENASSSTQKTKARPKRQKARKAKYTLSDSEEDEGEEWIPRKVSAPQARKMADHDHLSMTAGSIKKKAKQKSRGEGKQSMSKSQLTNRPRATLVICPLSVLSNWIDQIEQHVKPEAKLNVYVYYGPERNRNPDALSNYDIVLTTYNVVTHDYGSESPLHKVKWLRVVLDEGHTIRNPNARQTKAAHNLDSERRWILTGTPIQNSLQDLWSIFSFLKLNPFTDREWWNRTIQRPVTTGDPAGLRRLQALVNNTTLRRTKTTKVKGKPVLQLPERKVFIQHLQLSEKERKIYESVKNESKTIIGRYVEEGLVLTRYADVLVMLGRLRQLCCHPHLVSHVVSSLTSTAGSAPKDLQKKLINKMKLVLSSGSDEECPICLDSLKLPVITRCAHVFCKPCICEVIHTKQPNAKCPLCRGPVSMEHLLECPEEELDSGDGQQKDLKWADSSKINALMFALTEQRQKDPLVKSIIVSQFTKFLSVTEEALREAGFTFTRLDGSMNQKKRTEAIQAFQCSHADSPTIMLLSLKAGGVGLNLTAASRVFLMDPAWNPAAEEQCFDRCHRLGQTKEVIVTKFVVKDSVEENMLKIQQKKRELAAGAFGGSRPSASEIKAARINDIRTLVDL